MYIFLFFVFFGCDARSLALSKTTRSLRKRESFAAAFAKKALSPSPLAPVVVVVLTYICVFLSRAMFGSRTQKKTKKQNRRTSKTTEQSREESRKLSRNVVFSLIQRARRKREREREINTLKRRTNEEEEEEKDERV